MSKNAKPVSLPEKDYLSILDVITQFHQCETRQDLKKVFKTRLLPIFDAQSVLIRMD